MASNQYGVPPKQIATLSYTGPDIALAPVTEGDRAPTVNDINYPIDCFWRDTTTRVLWWLSGFDPTGALWVNLSASGSGLMSTLSDTANTKVNPDGTGNIQLSGGTSNISVVSDVPGFKIDFTIANQVSGTVTTTGAVTGDVITYALGATPGTYQFNCRVAGYDITTALSAGYNIDWAMRTTGAASVLIGTPEFVVNEEGALSAADVTIVASGNNAIVRVLGVAAKTIHWKADLQFTFVS